MRHRREPEHQEPETSTLEPHTTESAATHKPRRSAARNEHAEKQNGTPKTNGHAAEPKPSKGNFFERLAQMTESEWDRYRVYVYRRWPRISKSGEPHYIAVHREAIDEEFIKTMYGSGRYFLKLNDPRRTVDEHPLEIMDLAYPPKLSPDELVDCPENERYHRLWPSEEKKKPVEGGADSGAVRELAGLLKTVMAVAGSRKPTR